MSPAPGLFTVTATDTESSLADPEQLPVQAGRGARDHEDARTGRHEGGRARLEVVVAGLAQAQRREGGQPGPAPVVLEVVPVRDARSELRAQGHVDAAERIAGGVAGLDLHRWPAGGEALGGDVRADDGVGRLSGERQACRRPSRPRESALLGSTVKPCRWAVGSRLDGERPGPGGGRTRGGDREHRRDRLSPGARSRSSRSSV